MAQVALQSLVQGQRAAASGLLAGRWFHLPVRQKLGVNEDHIEKLLEAAHQFRVHLPGGWGYFNSLLKKKDGEKFAKICIKCDFLHTKGSCQNRTHMLPWSYSSWVWK